MSRNTNNENEFQKQCESQHTTHLPKTQTSCTRPHHMHYTDKLKHGTQKSQPDMPAAWEIGSPSTPPKTNQNKNFLKSDEKIKNHTIRKYPFCTANSANRVHTHLEL